jgi:hypothetical protein
MRKERCRGLGLFTCLTAIVRDIQYTIIDMTVSLRACASSLGGGGSELARALRLNAMSIHRLLKIYAV